MTDQQLTDPHAVTVLDADRGVEIDVLAEAVSVIDVALTKMMQRDLVSSGEVADLLLDVRTLLTTQQ